MKVSIYMLLHKHRPVHLIYLKTWLTASIKVRSKIKTNKIYLFKKWDLSFSHSFRQYLFNLSRYLSFFSSLSSNLCHLEDFLWVRIKNGREKSRRGEPTGRKNFGRKKSPVGNTCTQPFLFYSFYLIHRRGSLSCDFVNHHSNVQS